MPIEPEKEVVVPEVIEYDPNKNPDAISIVKQADGNWKGWAQKHGKLVEVREAGPDYCLQALMTHE